MILLYSLIVIIIVHEAGHFIAAKLCGCHVEIFAVGFGKTLLQKKIGSTIYQLNIFPLGGFCKLSSELEYSESPSAFTNMSYRKKVFISYAGILMNVLTGWPAFYFGYHHQILWLFAFGWYSLAIGLSNGLPIPALDGSYPLWFLLEFFIGKERTYAIIKKVFTVSFRIIMVLNVLSMPYLVYLAWTGQLI